MSDDLPRTLKFATIWLVLGAIVFVAYQWRQHEGAYLPLTLDVLRVTGGAITEIVTFHDDQFARLGLPERLPADGA